MLLLEGGLQCLPLHPWDPGTLLLPPPSPHDFPHSLLLPAPQQAITAPTPPPKHFVCRATGMFMLKVSTPRHCRPWSCMLEGTLRNTTKAAIPTPTQAILLLHTHRACHGADLAVRLACDVDAVVGQCSIVEGGELAGAA